MKSFKRALVIGEKNIFSELSQIIVVASEANTFLIDMLGKCKNEQALDSGQQADSTGQLSQHPS